MSNISRFLFKAGATCKEYLPEILTVLGIASTGAAVIFAHKDSLKAKEVLEEAKKDLEIVEEAREKCPDEYSEDDYKRETKLVKRKKVINYIKADWRCITSYLVGAGMIVTSAIIGRKRRTVDVAAIAALTTYISSLTAKYNQLEQAITDGKVKEIPDFVDSEGNPAVVYKCTSILDDEIYGEIGVPYGPYTIALTPETFVWKMNPGYLNIYNALKSAQARCNDKLKIKGFLTLEDVLMEAHIPYGEVNVDPNIAKVTGWTYGAKAEGDDYIDFGCWEYDENGDIDTLIMMPGDDGSECGKVYLSFNCEGCIIGKIPFGKNR